MKHIMRTSEEVWEEQKTVLVNMKELFSRLYRIDKYIEDANTEITNRSLGISGIIGFYTGEITKVEDRRNALERFTREIHGEIAELIDDKYNYAVMKLLSEIYDLNPNDVTYSTDGTTYNLSVSMSIIAIDTKLKKDFNKKSKALNKDEMSKDFKNKLINAIGHYYDSDIINKMSYNSLYSTFNKDMNLVIQYYEYLNPKDAKNLKDFLEEMSKDPDPRFKEDIKNIKYLAYTAAEPYRSAFFEYLPRIKIGSFKYYEKDSKGKLISQHYSPIESKIYVRLYPESSADTETYGKLDPRGPYVVFFHEIGHGIDDMLVRDTGKYYFFSEKSNSVMKLLKKEIAKNIRYDIDKIIETNGYNVSLEERDNMVNIIMSVNNHSYASSSDEETTYNQVVSNYVNRFNQTVTDGTVYEGHSDVYGGYSNNKLRGSYGHKIEYWVDSSNNFNGQQPVEYFASLYSRGMTNSITARYELDFDFPKTSQLIIDELMKSKN